MKRLLLCTAVLTVSAAVGCRSAGNQELLERDLRMQEDRINHLQGHVIDYRQQIECLQAENDSLRAQLAGSQGGVAPPVRAAIPYRTPQFAPPGGTVPEAQPPRVQPPSSTPGELPLGPPKIELPSSSFNERRPGSDPGGAQIAQITFNRALTGGYDADQQPGDDGVRLCIEPRTASGEIIPWQGPLSIVLMDPAMPGESARLARWDLAENEVADHYRRTPDGAGIQLELPWPTGVPQHRQLKLFARYVMADGRKLDASQDIEIVRTAGRLRSWTRSAHQARVPTVPIADSVQAPREPAGPVVEPDNPPDADNRPDDDTPEPAVARLPHWSPYR